MSHTLATSTAAELHSTELHSTVQYSTAESACAKAVLAGREWYMAGDARSASRGRWVEGRGWGAQPCHPSSLIPELGEDHCDTVYYYRILLYSR